MAYTTLSTLAAAIAADAGENSAAHPQTAYTAPIGSTEEGRRVGTPRVVWVPVGGNIETATEDESRLEKAAWLRRLTCRVTIVGADYDEAELELRAFLGALLRTQPLTAAPQREEHNDETLSGLRRYAITVTVEVELSVPHEVYTTVETTSVSHTATVTN